MRLISLNIERSAHLDRVFPFLEAYNPDAMLLQEVMVDDLELIKTQTKLEHCHFVAMARHPLEPGRGPGGVAILSRFPFSKTVVHHYAGSGSGDQLVDHTDLQSRMETTRYVAADVTLDGSGNDLRLATTHFPWTPDGKPRPYQEEALSSLMGQLGDESLIFTGDFNAPRGGPVFDGLAAKWRDNIPTSATTSLDPDLHRAGPLDLVVDGLFTTPDIHIADVELHAGLSDHKAITATVERQ